METTFGIGYHISFDAATAARQITTVPPSAFVQGQSLLPTTDTVKQQEDKKTPQQDHCLETTPTSLDVSQLQAQQQQQALEGRLRAQAILRKFEQQQYALLQSPFLPTATGDNTTEIPPHSAYVEQRRKAAIRERQRFQHAWSKNFAYLEAKHDAEKANMQQRISEATQAEAEAHAHYQRLWTQRQHQQQQQQQHKELQSQAGIGTRKRKHVTDKSTQMGLQNAAASPSQAALYLTGIPMDGSIEPRQVREIFRAYGSVTKVHFYRDKTTGELKGDGLVVYQVQSSSSSSGGTMQECKDLMETVCTQMNGAELVEGVVLHVEPAASHNSDSTTMTISTQPASEERTVEEKEEGAKEDDDDDDEELKDFFDSL